MSELINLQIFATVVDSGSFSAAARQLGLPASSISRRISGLEKELGFRLFTRSTRFLILSDAGTLYLKQVRRILTEVHSAEEVASQIRGVPEGILRVETRPGIGAYLIAPVLTAFLAQNKQIRIDLQLTSQQLDTLSVGVDIGIRFGIGRPSSLITRKLVGTKQSVYASPEYLERHGVPQTPADLLNHNCLRFSLERQTTIWRFRKDSQIDDIEIDGNLRCNDVNTIYTAICDGLGIGVNHEWVVNADVQARRLVPILTDYEVTTMGNFDLQVAALYVPGSQNIPKVKVFTEFLLKALPEMMQNGLSQGRMPRQLAAEINGD